MRYHTTGRDLGLTELDGTVCTDPVVSGCWAVLSSDGLRLQYDIGGGNIESEPLTPDDVLETGELSIEEPDDGIGNHETIDIYRDWNCTPGTWYEWLDAVVRATAVPCCDPSDPSGPFAAHKEKCAQNTLRDRNFHAATEGATWAMKQKVARNLYGVPDDEEK